MSENFEKKLDLMESGEWWKEHREFEPLPDYGDLMTLEDWLACVDAGGFIDYDGFGNYSDGKQMSNKTVKPSDVEKGKVDKGWTHVVWFNR